MQLKDRKSLNPQYRKHKPRRSDVNNFISALKSCLVSIKNAEAKDESEEFMKLPITTFLKKTFYRDNLVNTKGRIDLAIYTGQDLNSDVAVIIEAKKPSNKAEFLSINNINRKALQELLLYYLRERIDNKNNNIKTLIATNGYEWYLFKGEDFYKYFYKNIALVKEYTEWKSNQKDSSKTDLFYIDIAKKYISEVENELPFVYLNFTKKGLEEYTDESLNTLYKVFSDVNILGVPFGNDSNELNKSFYNELLHIIGLEEKKDKGKKVIYRKDEGKIHYASLLENTIFKLEDQDHLSKVKNYTEDKIFNVGLTLCLTWINRILFLKLLESQLQTYHPDEKEKYSFLNSNFIRGFDDLNDLFFSALAKKQEDRHLKFKDKYQYIPYLNSSLFERSSLENDTIEISALNDEAIEVYNSTVLKENGKQFKGKLSTLEYLFRFLDCFDFATDGTEGITDDEETKTLINSSVLGLIFEKINGYKEGSFYTPSYITMYMCKETLRNAVVQKFKEKEDKDIKTFEDLVFHCTRVTKLDDIKRLNTVFNSLKLCDPAVGSGHFLVSVLNELIVIKHELGLLIDMRGGSLAKYDIHIENDELYVTDEEGYLIDYKPKNTESARLQHTLFHEKKTIIENCLFGVDINPNSVKICRLRLWIELLKNAYYTKQGVLQTLPNIDINIKCGNSLISRFDLKDDLQDAFSDKDVKYNFTDYKEAVKQYKGNNSKEQKKEVLKIINEVKNNFISSLDDDTILYRQKAVGKYEAEKARQDTLVLIEEKITKVDKKILKELKLKADKAIQKETEIVNNKIYDNAFEWRFEFPEVLDELGNYIGFDVVIGNPPYIVVKKDNPSYSKFDWNHDLYLMFFDLSINKLLKQQGLLSFITPRFYLVNKNCMEIRKVFVDELNLLSLIETVPFEGVTTECVITIIEKKQSIHNNIPIFIDENKTFKLLNRLEKSLIKKRLDYTIISSLTTEVDNLLDKIEDNTTKLKEISIKSIRGMERCGKKSISKNLTGLKCLIGNDVRRFKINYKNTYVEPEHEEVKRLNDFFQLENILLLRRVSSDLISAVPEEFYTFNKNLFGIQLEDHFSKYFVCGLLNSSLMNFYYKNKFSMKKQEVFPEIQKYLFESLPIKIVESSKQKEIIEIVKALQSSGELNRLVLDKMVYTLYDLTDEEILIVEST